jgi:hypothetical protein
MAFLFQKKKPVAALDPQTVLEKLSAQLETFDKCQRHFEAQAEQLRQQAKVFARNQQKAKAVQTFQRARGLALHAEKFRVLGGNLEVIQWAVQDAYAMNDYVRVVRDADALLAARCKSNNVEQLLAGVRGHVDDHGRVVQRLGASLAPSQELGLEEELEALMSADEEAAPPRQTSVRPRVVGNRAIDDDLRDLMSDHGDDKNLSTDAKHRSSKSAQAPRTIEEEIEADYRAVMADY